MAGSHENSGGRGHSDISDKLRNPFHELKEKLKDTHLHDAKIGLIHQKYVSVLVTTTFQTEYINTILGINLGNSQIS